MKSSSRILRVLGVTLGLSAAGALFGGIAAAIAILVWGMGKFAGGLDGAVGAMGFAFSVGAVLGSIMGPFVAWGLLRHVPLGKAVLGATIGAFVGGSLTALLPATHPLLGGAVGLIGASVIMRVRYASKARVLRDGACEIADAELTRVDSAKQLIE